MYYIHEIMHLYDLVIKLVGFLIFKVCLQNTSVSVTQYQIWKLPWKNPGYVPVCGEAIDRERRPCN